MKYLFLIFCLFIYFSCKPPQKVGHSNQSDTIISVEELAGIIDTLSSDYFEGRQTGSDGIEKAATYIENYLKETKIQPFYTNYRDSFSIGEIQAYNIIGLIEANKPELKDEYILLSAHYDHIGKITGETDSVYNGANDNTTGVSTVLNIARILAENKVNSRNVIVAFFSGEEMGLLGSEHFAAELHKQGLKICCAVNVDMIGSKLTNKPGKVYLSGYKKSNMAEIFNRYIGSDEIVYWEKEELYGLFYLSDNYPIYQTFKIPAHTFCTFDFTNYDHYHRLTDEVKNIDIENTLILANTIKTGFVGISKNTLCEIKLIE